MLNGVSFIVVGLGPLLAPWFFEHPMWGIYAAIHATLLGYIGAADEVRAYRAWRASQTRHGEPVPLAIVGLGHTATVSGTVVSEPTVRSRLTDAPKALIVATCKRWSDLGPGKLVAAEHFGGALEIQCDGGGTVHLPLTGGNVVVYSNRVEFTMWPNGGLEAVPNDRVRDWLGRVGADLCRPHDSSHNLNFDGRHRYTEVSVDTGDRVMVTARVEHVDHEPGSAYRDVPKLIVRMGPPPQGRVAIRAISDAYVANESRRRGLTIALAVSFFVYAGVVLYFDVLT